MNCEKCAYYVSRPLTSLEKQYLMFNQNKLIDTRFCGIGGCDGCRFLDKDSHKAGKGDI